MSLVEMFVENPLSVDTNVSKLVISHLAVVLRNLVVSLVVFRVNSVDTHVLLPAIQARNVQQSLVKQE